MVSVLLYIEQVITGLDKAAATMKKGEKAVLTISPEYGFGNVEVQRDLVKVPQCSVLIYEVEMLDFVKVIANTGTWEYWVYLSINSLLYE